MTNSKVSEGSGLGLVGYSKEPQNRLRVFVLTMVVIIIAVLLFFYWI